MKKISLLSLILLFVILQSCDVLAYLAKNTSNVITQGAVSDSQIISGLKEALKVGTGNAIGTLSQKDGFLKNARFKIPFPSEVKQVEATLRSFGMGKLVDDFVAQMNKGAEEAVKEAKPIFVSAITSMSIADARNILFGNETAATQYFRGKTLGQLTQAFTPKVKGVLDNKVKVTQTWNEITTAYNKLPGTKPVTTDLIGYITGKSIDALFTRIGEEEKNIRQNPGARVNDILKKVFGELDKR